MNGCFDEVPNGQTLVELGGYPFKRCPITQFGAEEEVIGALARRGGLKSMNPMEAVKMPAKMYAALQWCEVLLLEERRDHGT